MIDYGLIRNTVYVQYLLFLYNSSLLTVVNCFDFQAYMRKLRKAKARDEPEKVESLWQKKPIYRLDHIVRERYPTFIDALRDLEDPLTLCFLFSRLARKGRLQEGIFNCVIYLYIHYVFCFHMFACVCSV